MLCSRRWKLAGVAGLGLTLSTLTGCQTWVGGMTLPSGRYLDHPPQYFPQDPVFPLERELATMEANYRLGVGEPVEGFAPLPAGVGVGGPVAPVPQEAGGFPGF